MAITIPELNSVSVLDDTDNIMLTHSNGNSEKISGANFKADMIKDKIENNNGNAVSVNAVSTILATSTTITGPELGTGGNIKILFTSAIAGVDTSTGMSLTYNGDTIAVKVGKDGALEDFKAVEVSTGVYKYLQAYTTLELVFDGTYFIIVGNPMVYSDTDLKIYADGYIDQYGKCVYSFNEANANSYSTTSELIINSAQIFMHKGTYIMFLEGVGYVSTYTGNIAIAIKDSNNTLIKKHNVVINRSSPTTLTGNANVTIPKSGLYTVEFSIAAQTGATMNLATWNFKGATVYAA